MSKTILQNVLFENTLPSSLYATYMNGERHSVATGAPAQITDTEGSNFSAHNGYITGKNLQLIKDKLIVQSWRAQSWSSDELDSTFILHFEPQGNDTLMHVIHANVPTNAFDDLNSGWHKMYWEPFRLYLAGTPISKAAM